MPGMKPTMNEWKAGTLHSGSKTGPKVTSQKQAVAIGLSEDRKAGKKVAPMQRSMMSGSR
jgi:Family of unknown function (DUF6496)